MSSLCLKKKIIFCSGISVLTYQAFFAGLWSSGCCTDKFMMPLCTGILHIFVWHLMLWIISGTTKFKNLDDNVVTSESEAHKRRPERNIWCSPQRWSGRSHNLCFCCIIQLEACEHSPSLVMVVSQLRNSCSSAWTTICKLFCLPVWKLYQIDAM